MATLGSVCQFLNGGTPSKAIPSYFDGDIPWITSADIDGPVIRTARSFITEEAIKKSATNKVATGSVLLVTRTGVGKVAVAGTDLCFSQDVTALLPDRNKLNVGYLVQYLQTKQTYFARLARGATIKGITRDVVADLCIPLPSLPEQHRIAAILEQAETLRAKRRQTLAQLDVLPQTIFTEMFGNPITNAKGIQTVQLSDVTTRITDGTHLTPRFVPSGVPFIFVKNIKNGDIDFRTDKFISEEEHGALYKRCPVEDGDVLYTTVGATYGQAAPVGSFTRFAFQRHLAHLKPDRDKILPQFPGTIMQLPFVKNQADRWARGVAQPTINLKELREFVIPLPALSLQRDFTIRVTAIEQLKLSERASLAQFDALFASLQHRAFRGEL